MEIEINGFAADLGNSEIAITRKSIDINNPDSRFVQFTNQFNLPTTNINKLIFESPEKVSSNNRSFDKLYSVLVRDLFFIFNGNGFLKSSTINGFNFQLVDKSKELFDFFKQKLKDISWDDKDTILTSHTKTADITDCWYWGDVNFNENAIDSNLNFKYYRPLLYVNGLLNRAITNFGYTLTNPDYNLAITANHQNFYFTSYQKTLVGTYTTGNITGLNTNDFEKNVTTTSTKINIGDYKTKFRLRGEISALTTGSTITIRATNVGDPSKISESILTPTIGVVDFLTSDFAADGSANEVEIIVAGSVTMDVLFYSLIDELTEDLSTNPFEDYKIKVYDNLPDLTYLDLFRTLCLIGNYIPEVDSFTKTFAFKSLKFINKNAALDWSTKMVQQSESITNDLQALSQNNRVKYTNDLTVQRSAGEYIFTTDNENLQNIGDYITLPFGASIDVNGIGTAKIYNNTTRITTQTVNIRIYNINGTVAEFGSIDWNVIKDNYQFSSLNRVRIIDCEMNLNKLDVYNWDASIPVYIEYFGSIFLVLEINNFISGKLTKVKLWQISK